MFPKIGGKPPEWMVKIIEKPMNKWMIWWVSTYHLRKHPYKPPYANLPNSVPLRVWFQLPVTDLGGDRLVHGDVESFRNTVEKMELDIPFKRETRQELICYDLFVVAFFFCI